MTAKFFLFGLGCIVALCSFVSLSDGVMPRTMTRTAVVIDGLELHRTIVVLDKRTSREDLIYTCQFLKKEGIELTFDKLTISRSALGILGRKRITLVEGELRLPDGVSQRFRAGGIFSFRSVKLQFTEGLKDGSAKIEMIEVID